MSIAEQIYESVIPMPDSLAREARVGRKSEAPSAEWEKRPHRAFRQDLSEGAGKKTPAFPTYAG